MIGIVCLMLEGKCLTDAIRNKLALTASEMAERDLGEMQVEGEDFEGTVTSDFKIAGVGTFFGIGFKARINSFLGKTEVSFILPHAVTKEVLENGYWISSNPHMAQKAPLN